ncbi:MAG: SpoIIE family protein phosphatase [candidate division KSB1 bacterium]|nr:SpoIIE family protein phosphatase [candidate division KSB1 bacterium]
MKRLQSLWVKMTLAVVVLVVAIMASVSYFFSYRELKAERREVEGRIERLAKQIASIRLAETEGWYVYQNYIDNLIRADFSRDLVYIAIFDERDSLTAYALNREWLDLGRRELLTSDEERQVVRLLSQGAVAEESRADLGSVPVQIRDAERSYGTVEVGFSLVELNDAFRRKRLTNFLLLAVFTALGVVTSAIMSYRIVTPLHRLARAMQRISAGDLTSDVRVRSSDEIGELARTFNAMVVGLREKAAIEGLTRELGFTFELRRVAQLAIESIQRGIAARRAVLFVQEGEEGGRFRAVWDSARGEVGRSSPCLDLTSAAPLLARKEPLPYPFRGEGQTARLLRAVARSLRPEPCALVVPLWARDELVGVLALSAPSDRQSYSDRDQTFLVTLGTQAALAIDNALLHVRLTEQEKLRRELEIARDVQRKLLPQGNPHLPGWDIDGICLPAAAVGGDYFDYLEVGPQKLGVVIADVTGKGTSAAFYMAEIKGIMVALSTDYQSPAELLCQLNRKLRQRLDPRVFATVAYGVIDLGSGRLRLARAGHSSVLLRRAAGVVEALLPPGIAVGLADSALFDAHIHECVSTIAPGDTLVFYTDGITEAMNQRREEFGEQALISMVSERTVVSAESLRKQILRRLRMFTGRTPLHDDVTLVVVRRQIA